MNSEPILKFLLGIVETNNGSLNFNSSNIYLSFENNQVQISG